MSRIENRSWFLSGTFKPSSLNEQTGITGASESYSGKIYPYPKTTK